MVTLHDRGGPAFLASLCLFKHLSILSSPNHLSFTISCSAFSVREVFSHLAGGQLTIDWMWWNSKVWQFDQISSSHFIVWFFPQVLFTARIGVLGMENNLTTANTPFFGIYWLWFQMFCCCDVIPLNVQFHIYSVNWNATMWTQYRLFFLPLGWWYTGGHMMEGGGNRWWSTGGCNAGGQMMQGVDRKREVSFCRSSDLNVV